MLPHPSNGAMDEPPRWSRRSPAQLNSTPSAGGPPQAQRSQAPPADAVRSAVESEREAQRNGIRCKRLLAYFAVFTKQVCFLTLEEGSDRKLPLDHAFEKGLLGLVL